ncbi:SDR family oxidoreductase [Methylogaea oryzae]|nr:SDR family oxidoreductase [Methylogaea oryzae]
MTILLTGATGYLGKHLLAGLLGQGERVAVVVRPRGEALAERVLDVLQPFALPAECLGPDHLTVLAGDVTEAHLGLSEADRAELRRQGVRAVLHSAGLTRFEEELAERLDWFNRQGTVHAYRLARDLGAAEFHHVSTAFVAGEGDAEGAFSAADLERGQRFRNPYEKSKFEAERFLRAAHAEDGMPINVYRPSICVGGVPPIGKGQSTSTVYAFLKAGHFLKTATLRDLKRGAGSFSRGGGMAGGGGSLHLPLRIVADAAVEQNLVSVEYVAESTLAGLRRGASGYTVVPQLGARAIAIGEMRDIFATVLGVTGVEMVDESAFDVAPATFVEQCFARATQSYLPYLFSESRFAEEPSPPGFPRAADYAVDLTRIAHDFLSAMEAPERGADARGALTRLALDALQVSGPADYFDRLVEGQIGRGFLRRMAFADARIQFAIDDSPPFNRTIHFASGVAKYAEPADSQRPDCTLSMDRELFDAVMGGREDLRKGFFTGRVKLRGNKAIGLKFGFLLGQYLRQSDEHVLEELAG